MRVPTGRIVISGPPTSTVWLRRAVRLRREDAALRQNPIGQLLWIFINSQKEFLTGLIDQCSLVTIAVRVCARAPQLHCWCSAAHPSTSQSPAPSTGRLPFVPSRWASS